jgi:hypothetical protein
MKQRGRNKLKPIKVFWSTLGQRFYAARSYREFDSLEDPKKKIYQITGEKFDVTDDIADAITKHQITFTPKEPKKS